MFNMLRPKKRQPDVRKIKKHSDIVRNNPATRLVVGGTREKTSTGYKVRGYAGESFETFYEVFMERTSTDIIKSAGDRTIRLLSGTLYVIVQNEAAQGTDPARKLIPGDEVAIAKNTPYRIATSTEQAEIFVCQDAGYEDSLEVVAPAAVVTEVPAHLLQEPSFEDRLRGSKPGEVIPPRRGSKAKEQLQKQMTQREASAQLRPPSDKQVPELANREMGLNPRPSGGHFTEEGAG